MIRESLRKGINRGLDDTRRLEVTRECRYGYVDHNWEEIMAALREWESKGYLTILKDPRFAEPKDVCVLMHSYIERASPWTDWPPRRNAGKEE